MMQAPHILMLFLDGVGIGKKDSTCNPFFIARMETLRSLLGGKMPHIRDSYRSSATLSLVPLNATLGVRGLPQSGTGQTSLLTGINASRMIGKHFGPYPYSSLRPIISERNIFRQLHLAGRSVFCANAFPRQFFEHLDSQKTHTTAIAMAWLMAGFELNNHQALFDGHALSSDITNERWHALGYPDLPTVTPREAGKRLAGFAGNYDFVFYEYFFTDHAGHSQSRKDAAEVLEKFDGLLEGVLEAFDQDSMLLIITSDHGNIEDLSTKSHTRNPVPLLALGTRHRELTMNTKNLTHITPAILRMLQ